jgi:hypothetical protein
MIPHVAIVVLNWNTAPDTLAKAGYPGYHLLAMNSDCVGDARRWSLWTELCRHQREELP